MGLTRGRFVSATGGQPTAVFGQPADGILLTVDRQNGSGTSTGSVTVGCGVPMPIGRITSLTNVSLWTLGGTEVAFRPKLGAYTHTDGSYQSVYVSKVGDLLHGSQYWLRTSTAPQVSYETDFTPPQQPASYFMAPPDWSCAAFPHPFKLPTWVQTFAANDAGRWAEMYESWQRVNDLPNSSSNLRSSRIAIYNRAHNLMCLGLMKGDAYFCAQALRMICAGTRGATTGFLVSLIPPADISNLGGEFDLDMLELYLTGMVSGSPDFVTAMDAGVSQLQDIARMGNSGMDGTEYNVYHGWERATARAFQGYILAANLGRSFSAGSYAGYGTDGEKVGLAYLPTRAAKMLDRAVVSTGQSNDSDLVESWTSNVIRATNPARLNLSVALPQRDTVANGSVNINIATQDITIPSGATMTASGVDKYVPVLWSWNGSAIVSTVGTIRTITSGTGPAQFAQGAPQRSLLPSLPAGNQEIGHVWIVCADGNTYTADTTSLPATNATTSAGISAYWFMHTRTQGQKPYMLGMAMLSMIHFIEWYPNDASCAGLQARIEAICTDLYTNHWLPASGHFTYVTVNAVRNGMLFDSGTGSRTPNIQWRSLNVLVGACFAWVGYKTNSATWKARAKEVSDYALSAADTSGIAWWERYSPSNSNNPRSGDEAMAYFWIEAYHRLYR